MEQICIHFFVSGKVQKVSYRFATCQKAKELNISGWVRNLPDGRVELLACGKKDHVLALAAWLWQGPPPAIVNDVFAEEMPFIKHDAFTVVIPTE